VLRFVEQGRSGLGVVRLFEYADDVLALADHCLLSLGLDPVLELGRDISDQQRLGHADLLWERMLRIEHLVPEVVKPLFVLWRKPTSGKDGSVLFARS